MEKVFYNVKDSNRIKAVNKRFRDCYILIRIVHALQVRCSQPKLAGIWFGFDVKNQMFLVVSHNVD